MTKNTISIIDYESHSLMVSFPRPENYKKLPDDGCLWSSWGKFYRVIDLFEKDSGDIIASVNEVKTSTINQLYSCLFPDAAGFLIPEGQLYDKRYVPDGIWYCRHNNYSSGITSVNYLADIMGAKVITDNDGTPISGFFKIGDSTILDIEDLCGLYDYTEYILNSQEFREFLESGYSLNDLVSKIVSLIFRKNLDIKNGSAE